VLSVPRATYRYTPVKRSDEDELRGAIISLATRFGRYGYRQITRLLKGQGITVNYKRVERIWRQAGLKVPAKQSRRERLWLSDGSCIRLRAERDNHVWSYDFVEDKTVDGRKIRFLNIIDEYSHRCIASIPRRTWRGPAVAEALAEAFSLYGCPEYLRSDNGPEFIASHLRKWLETLSVQTTYIEPGSPWENGYIESFNSRMRNEHLNGEIFGNLYEAQVLTKRWVALYNTLRPHSSLGGRPPAPQSYTVDSSEKTVTLKQAVWNIAHIAEACSA